MVRWLVGTKTYKYPNPTTTMTLFTRFPLLLLNTFAFKLMRPPPSLSLLHPPKTQLFTVSTQAPSSSSPSLSLITMKPQRQRQKGMCIYHSQGKCTKMDDPAHMERFSHDTSTTSVSLAAKTNTHRWKPLCLYYTHGKCTKMDDFVHNEMFNHDCSAGLEMNVGDLGKLQSQGFDYFLVLDLEGKVEILEFPVLVIDAKTLGFVDFFHRFVRPVKMSEQRINQYIEGKYGKLGVKRVWHDTAIPFKEVLQDFEVWMTHNQLWKRELGGSLRRAAFATCGNWDLKTKIPQQCRDSRIELPSYFMEWINLKDIYLNFYNRMATGMRPMMNGLGISLLGSHHLGIDDSKNIARVMQRMLSDGALMQITAKRSSGPHGVVEFLFENRIQ